MEQKIGRTSHKNVMANDRVVIKINSINFQLFYVFLDLLYDTLTLFSDDKLNFFSHFEFILFLLMDPTKYLILVDREVAPTGP